MSVSHSALWFQGQSLSIVALMLWGLYHRKQRPIHVKTMATVVVWDILLILQIELTRGAIAKSVSASDNTVLLNVHVGLALACVLGYIGLVLTGWEALRGRAMRRTLHRRLGFATALVRILVLITSFWAVPA